MLDEQAIDTMAECVSKGIHLQVETAGKPRLTGGWCDARALPSMAVVSLRGIANSGVYDLGTFTVCAKHGPTT